MKIQNLKMKMKSQIKINQEKKEWCDKEIINNWHYNRLSMVFYLRK